MKHLALLMVFIITFSSNAFASGISELSFASYDVVTKVEVITETNLRQLIIARDVVMEEMIVPHFDLTWDYLSNEAEWELYDVYSKEYDRTLRCVYFQHIDDSSYSVYFEPETSKMVYVMYEN